jgi:phage/plasmid-associated DNA primase
VVLYYPHRSRDRSLISGKRGKRNLPQLIFQVKEATSDYRGDMDTVGQWIEERCLLDQGATVPTSALHMDYKGWAANEIGFELSPARFGRDLTDRGFNKIKGTGGRRLTRGLRLIAEARSSIRGREAVTVIRPTRVAAVAVNGYFCIKFYKNFHVRTL